MIFLEKIDYDDEEVLALLVKKYPDEVVDFFGKGLKKKRSSDGKYEAIPYEFYNKFLKQELSNFYKKFSKSELEYAKQERKKADEQEELRKYEFEVL